MLGFAGTVGISSFLDKRTLTNFGKCSSCPGVPEAARAANPVRIHPSSCNAEYASSSIIDEEKAGVSSEHTAQALDSHTPTVSEVQEAEMKPVGDGHTEVFLGSETARTGDFTGASNEISFSIGGDLVVDEADDDIGQGVRTNNAGVERGYSVPSEQDYVSVKQDTVDADRESYHSVVDVDITAGGMLSEDVDNNELFCGVGFDALLENSKLVENLEREFSITTATHVQLAAIPRIQQCDNVVVQGHTGTGKTMAFLLPLLEAIDTEADTLQAVIVAPTRELAMQIAGECTRLSEGTGIVSLSLIGGANPTRQVEKLRRRSPNVVIGTPGRLVELMKQRALSLKRVDMFVVDEVDQCLQEPFRDSVTDLLTSCPKSRQLILVSATSDVIAVRNFASQHMRDPVLLRVGDKQPLPKNISNYYAVVPPRLRIETLRKLMFAEPLPTKAICFVDDPRRADIVLERLHRAKVAAGGLRGTAEKSERAEVIRAFRKGLVNLLVTTEVAARGIDVSDVSHVFNLDLPTDADHYVHRAGRCGRVGREGVVVSIATSENAFVIGRLEKQLNVNFTRIEPRGGRYAPPLDRTSILGRSYREESKSEIETSPKSEASKEQRSRNDNNSVLGSSKKNRTDTRTNEVKETQVDAQAKPRSDAPLKKERSKPKIRMSEKRKRNKSKALPKHVTGNTNISKFAKQNGWVGNRSS